MVGLPNPYVALGAVLLLVGTASGAYFYGNHVGSATTEAAWQKREAKTADDSAKVLAAANDRVTKAEHKNADDLAAVATTYEEKLKEQDNAYNHAIATARAGRLRIGTVGPANCNNPVPKAGSATSVSDGETRTELSKQAAGFLIGEASRADKITEQLTACQAVICSYFNAVLSAGKCVAHK